MSNQMPRTYCWPEHWIEAAMRAGFAHYKGNGQWEFINDKLRDMLAEFAASIEENAENEERERCAKVCDGTSNKHLSSGQYVSIIGDRSVYAGGKADGARECAAAIRGEGA